MNKEEKPKKVNSIQDRIKQFQNAPQQPKPEEKKKVNPPNAMAERFKKMQEENKINSKKSEPLPKRFSANINPVNFNPQAVKIDDKNNKNENKKEDNKVESKFKQMQKMLNQRGGRMIGAPRPSAQIMGMPNLGQQEIMKENVDKQRPGFNPVDELEKNLDNIVVKKDKKTKTKPNFQG